MRGDKLFPKNTKINGGKEDGKQEKKNERSGKELGN